jgi:hypothetical protein
MGEVMNIYKPYRVCGCQQGSILVMGQEVNPPQTACPFHRRSSELAYTYQVVPARVIWERR